MNGRKIRIRMIMNDTMKQLVLCLIIFTISVWILLKTELQKYHYFIIPKTVDLEYRSFYLVSGPGCHIPNLNIYDSSIVKFLDEDDYPPNCDINTTGVLVKSNLTHLYIDNEALQKINLRPENTTCCYRSFWRENITEYKYSKKCKLFKNGFNNIIRKKFVRVECHYNGRLIYKDFYFFLPDQYRTEATNFTPDKNVSILILGIDSVSRLNFRRQMRATHSFLIDNTKSVEFYGYNKVDDNTFPNLIPILTGNSVQELEKLCWPSPFYYFDNCSFIWNDFKKSGFVTGFGEDSSWMGIFEYSKKGFKKDPTDIYLRIFNHVCETELGHDKRLNSYTCVGPKLSIEVLLDAVKKFTIKLNKKRSFGFFWENSMSHDFLNLPKYGDTIHLNFFKQLLIEGIFDNSIVIVLSDHGIRWGNIRKTYQGYIEERLPLLTITSPNWFKRRFQLAWANMKRNAHRLTTPYDVYETLKDLINLTQIEDKKIKERTEKLKSGNLTRGISLFLPVPLERTCENADIEDHWCTCHKGKELSVNNPRVIRVSLFVINYINSLLKGYSQCSKLEANKIISARVMICQEFHTYDNSNVSQAEGDIYTTINSHKDDKDMDEIYNLKPSDYTVRFETKPGGGIFESTVNHDPHRNILKLTGSVSRINTYGNSSSCISHYKLKLYCYCIT